MRTDRRVRIHTAGTRAHRGRLSTSEVIVKPLRGLPPRDSETECRGHTLSSDQDEIFEPSPGLEVLAFASRTGCLSLRGSVEGFADSLIRAFSGLVKAA